MKKICGIYMIENVINNKKYIGQSVNVYKRWKQHRDELEHNKHNNHYLQSSWNKYGDNYFTFTIIKECSKDELDYYEVMYIEKFNTMDRDFGYNLESGGRKNKRISDDSIKKISIAVSGENNPFYGKTHSEESLTKMRCPVYCPELDKIFSGTSIAESELGINSGGISACLSGKQKSAGKHPVSGDPLRWFRVGEDGNILDNIPNRYIDKRVKQVYCIELDRIFNGTREVERELGITHNCVSACCTGKQKAVIYPENGEKIHFIYINN